MVIAYTTRERVKRALDVNETAHANDQIDDAIRAATPTIDRLCQRSFVPWLGTRHFDYPPRVRRTETWRLWLDDNDLISLTSFTAAGATVPLTSLKLRPSNAPGKGKPYTHIELDISAESSFDVGDTFQENLAVTGLWGYSDVARSCGGLATAVDASTTTIDVTDGSLVGVGSLLRFDDERVDVTDRDWLDTSATLATTAATQDTADDTLNVSNGAVLNRGELIRLGTEVMRIMSISGNVIIVKRAVDGSRLAAHTIGTQIDGSRRLTVERGAQNTTPATHSIAAVTSCWVPPRLVDALAVAEAIDQFEQERAGYGRQQGSEDNQLPAADGTGLAKARERVWASYARKMRSRAA